MEPSESPAAKPVSRSFRVACLSLFMAEPSFWWVEVERTFWAAW